MEFRRSAVDTLEGPEDLDTPLQLTRPRGWLALAGLCLVMAVGVTWAFVGELPRETTTTGVLTRLPNTGLLVAVVELPRDSTISVGAEADLRAESGAAVRGEVVAVDQNRVVVTPRSTTGLDSGSWVTATLRLAPMRPIDVMTP